MAADDTAGALSTVKRQAVVLIHGIGEQKPMETLESFAWCFARDQYELTNAGFEETLKGDVWLRQVPDDVTGQSYSYCLSGLDESPLAITDFYEFYWAHHAARTNLLHMVLRWSKQFLQLPKNRIPPPLRRALRLARFAKGFAIVFVVSLIVSALALAIPLGDYLDRYKDLVGVAGLFVSPLCACVIAWMTAKFFKPLLLVLGDAAQYLYVDPQNVEFRDRVLSAGVEMLDRLHAKSLPDDKTPQYHRIVVVGHSLGSMIGHDILSLYFLKKNGYRTNETLQTHVQKYPGLKELRQWSEYGASTIEDTDEFKQLVAAARELLELERKLDSREASNSSRLIEKRDAFRRLQKCVFKKHIGDILATAEPEQPVSNYKVLDWRISDFVTIGSPLTYSALLRVPEERSHGTLPKNRQDLKSMTRTEYSSALEEHLQNVTDSNWPTNSELELAKSRGAITTCPPHGPADRVFAQSTVDDRVPLLFSSAFALTRWTNFYVPNDGKLLFGDIVSGPLAPVLGLGIKDIRIDPKEVNTRRHFWLFPSRMAHTSYWKDEETDWEYILDSQSHEIREGGKALTRVDLLRDALELQGFWEDDHIDDVSTK